MTDPLKRKVAEHRSSLVEQVGDKASRKLRSRRDSHREFWFGFGMMGLIGWSVVVPTLLGAALGIWLDRRHAGQHSWTLPLLIAGVVVGCWNAWFWVAREHQELGKGEGDHDA